MASLKKQAIRVLSWLEQQVDDFRHWLLRSLGLRSSSQLRIECYRGYSNGHRIVLSGRVLKYKPLSASSEQSKWRNFIDTYRRFGTDEVPGAVLQARIGDNTFRVTTDEEGYFLIDAPLAAPLPAQPHELWLTGNIELLQTPWGQMAGDASPFELMLPASGALVGVISDIDDTILHTHVTSLLKIKTLYYTIFHNAFTRKAFQEVEYFFQALHHGITGRSHNPFFYVSNSPWNLYDLLIDFLTVNELPKGPVLLRDIGLPNEPRPKGYEHKYATIARILDMYPALPFLLIGDSGERDADIYLEIARQYPQRIHCIYIHDVRHRKRARRIAALIRETTHVPIMLFKHYREVTADAAGRGWL